MSMEPIAVPASRPAIIKGKLVPPAITGREVERPHLEERIAGLIEERRVVVVSATAGAGKSTAVVAALRRLGRPVAWLTLDWTDAAPGRLLTYLEAALVTVTPAAAGVATAALAGRISHAEAAGLLAEAVADDELVLVLDDLERLGDEGEAWPVLASFLRYAPVDLHTVLISRGLLPPDVLGPLPHTHGVGVVGEDELAFTASDAELALCRLGQPDVDAAAAVEATGGWVTGVLFEAWRSDEHVRGTGGELDPLYGYLSVQITDRLSAEDRDFLVRTSVLPEVTVASAVALGLGDAAARMASLRRGHIPVIWTDDGRTMRAHSRFREYLLTSLQECGETVEQEQRCAYGRLLAAAGHHEEATDEFLRAGAPREAVPSAAQAIAGLIERMDLAMAERWLSEIAPLAPPEEERFAVARMMLALTRDDFGASVRLADELKRTGRLVGALQSSPFMAGLLAWAYVLMRRVSDAEALVDPADTSPQADAIRFLVALARERNPQGMPAVPPMTGGPLDAFVFPAALLAGRLTVEPAPHMSPWLRARVEPWAISMLRARGRVREALERAEAFTDRDSVAFRSIVLPEVLLDAGRRDEAWAEVREGARLARAYDSDAFLGYNWIVEARVAGRLDRDPRAIRTALARFDENPRVAALPLYRELTDVWRGYADLLEQRDEEALERLERAVASMQAGDRLLGLALGAVYLAEARWRALDEEGADEAADIGMAVALRQGTNQMLLKALADFPAVAARRIDAEPGADSPWHDLGRALLAQGVALDAQPRVAVQLREFGAAAILVNDGEERPRIAKSYELLALLARAGPDGADRERLLDALFDGRRDESTRAYLRQAIRWLRYVLPEDALRTRGASLHLSEQVAVRAESMVLEARLAEAARLQGAERLDATLAALTIYDRGPYLPEARSAWVDERRQELDALAVEARATAAELAFADGRYDLARRLAAAVLEADPYREATWRLAMRVDHALGDDAGVMRAYRACERALKPLSMAPSPTTRRLLESLRR